MTDTRLADISEFQANFDAVKYKKAGYRCIIARAHNGYRPDYQWPKRRDYIRAEGFTAVGYYQYLVSDRDPVSQARDFCDCVGALRDNEFVICDSEEGSGDQIARVTAWFGVVDSHYGFPSTLYASESWFHDRLGGAARWRSRPRWMAAYRASEPADPHELWQYSSSAGYPGLLGNIDSNLFHGTDREFLATMRPVGASGPGLPEGTRSIAVGTMPDGRLEVFAELKSGEVLHRWNASDGGWVEGWHSLGKP